MRECFEVDLFAPDPYEVSALIISNWAWPGASETSGHQRLYLSPCSWFTCLTAPKGRHGQHVPERDRVIMWQPKALNRKLINGVRGRCRQARLPPRVRRVSK